jgi:hypothetical protein
MDGQKGDDMSKPKLVGDYRLKRIEALLERIAVALEPAVYTIAAPIGGLKSGTGSMDEAQLHNDAQWAYASLIHASGLNTTSTEAGMVHPMQNTPVCGLCGSGGGQHDDGCANER